MNKTSLKNILQHINVIYFQLIFIIVSDDMNWVEKKLYGRIQRGFNVFLVKTGNLPKYISKGK